MYVSFGATGISLSNMMHILSDEEKQRWKSLQAVDYCLWVFCLWKGCSQRFMGGAVLGSCVVVFFFLFIVFVFKFWLEKCQHWALCTRECLYHGCLNSLWLWASLLKTTVKRGPGISSEQANFSASFSNLLRVVSAAPTGHHWWKERFKALQLLFMSLALQHLDLDNKLCLRITISTGLWKLYAAETLSCY